MTTTRLEKVGTIYSRTKAVLNSGVLRSEYQPIWFKIYEHFPPKYEPRYDRVPSDTSPVPPLVYQEDVIRAAFYKQFGDQMEVVNLHDKNTELLSQKFIRAFEAVDSQASEKDSFNDKFVQAVDLLEKDGIRLRDMPKDYATTIRLDQTRFKMRPSAAEKEIMNPSRPRPSFKDLFKELKDLQDKSDAGMSGGERHQGATNEPPKKDLS